MYIKGGKETEYVAHMRDFMHSVGKRKIIFFDYIHPMAKSMNKITLQHGYVRFKYIHLFCHVPYSCTPLACRCWIPVYTIPSPIQHQHLSYLFSCSIYFKRTLLPFIYMCVCMHRMLLPCVTTVCMYVYRMLCMHLYILGN